MCKRLVSMFLLAVVIGCSQAWSQAPVDDWQTIGLWHMDSVVPTGGQYDNGPIVADDSSVRSVPNNRLTLGLRIAGGSAAANLPTLVPGLYGNALSFDGGDMAYSHTAWGNDDSVKVEFYFKPGTPVGNRVEALCNVTNSWNITLTWNSSASYGKAVFTVYHPGGTLIANSDWVPAATLQSQWNNVVALVDAGGNVSVSIAGSPASPGGATTGIVTGINDCHHPTIYIGGRYSNTPSFTGIIDEVKISIPTKEIPAFVSPYQDNYNTFLLYHFDEISDQSPARTPDDDSYNPGRSLTPARDLDGILQPTGEPYAGPTLVTSFGGDPNEGFGRCLQFDGFQNIKVQGTDENDDFGIPNDNFRIELWAVHDAAKLNDGWEYYFFHQPSRFRFSLRDLAGGVWGIRWVTWTSSTGAASVLDVTVPDATVWHHYAFEFYQGEMKVYIDGIVAGTKTLTDTSVSPAIRQIFIGSSNTGSNKIIGRIDEFKISRAVDLIPECGAWGYSPADINKDCYVNDLDIIEMARQWLIDCTQPGVIGCE